MTKQAGFKRRVRARMAKTDESYATARSRLLTEHPGTTPDDSPLDWMPEMDRMAEGPHPLLRLDPPGHPVERTTRVRLTYTGARVLAGEADQIALNGIDRWIGGVHLEGRRVPWRWDDGTETIAHMPATM